ncbi:MAG TPA: beta-ketoacyl-ACP synthase III [Candidatus Marinimicrobia bacterium]|jgi:3-oxoacyl-[acyl-carrier-protein] synthase-3|nr:3-oxoacyl-ACP synthase [Candidatus Neomarinimicrobiota bacterium]MDP6276230.1 beta-ketoacyl-ACP synthase III [Candidatus Neomarinimicrobiota bacterium]MDP7217504.1 beta-ketoacyl-ACP synthase III [Candidatus Neomarinimicrobiota bacterium]MDP7437352.1 beta-ketoacyl-ACP synthase III [Candidatus Neomarinimicrobiota bacterium]HJL74945.1 beta-ketoacyl-ACP synthase III [Candidatus Neomarinimicrobiota bacterium]|tara:strand:+ start:1886 stop:2881 length:996 start_codon:yes stop_codon:yes gene_type:complete
MNRTAITGMSFHVPDKIVTNTDLEEMMNTSDEWIRTRSGIEKRHWVENDEGGSDLSLVASKKAMEQAGVTGKDIDMVIVGTASSDYYFPGIGAQLQDMLSLNTIGAFDIRVGCSAFIYGLAIADNFIKTGQCKTILLVGVDVLSPALEKSPDGRDVGVLFGDGAGAVILQPGQNGEGILSTHLHSEGKYVKELWCELPSFRLEGRGFSNDMIEKGRHKLIMNGREVFKHAVTRFPEVIQEALDANDLTMDDISQVIPHQANHRITEAVAKRLGVARDLVYSNIHRYGNTTAATIPIAMCEAFEEGKFKQGDHIILAAFGSGFTWASAAIKW